MFWHAWNAAWDSLHMFFQMVLQYQSLGIKESTAMYSMVSGNQVLNGFWQFIPTRNLSNQLQHKWDHGHFPNTSLVASWSSAHQTEGHGHGKPWGPCHFSCFFVLTSRRMVWGAGKSAGASHVSVWSWNPLSSEGEFTWDFCLETIHTCDATEVNAATIPYCIAKTYTWILTNSNQQILDNTTPHHPIKW